MISKPLAIIDWLINNESIPPTVADKLYWFIAFLLLCISVIFSITAMFNMSPMLENKGILLGLACSILCINSIINTYKYARKEIESIVKTGESKKILKNCVGCMSCNHYCPNNCAPYALIIKKWNDKYRKNGLPSRAKLILTLPYKKSYIHSFIIQKLPKEELEWINEWEKNIKNPEGKETMIYTG